jgi:hypothetical protein
MRRTRSPCCACASGCATEQRDELAAFHYSMPPVLATGRTAHLDGDCCDFGRVSVRSGSNTDLTLKALMSASTNY